jgi:HEAT repeat protein
MELTNIQDCLESPDPQKRMRGITELRNYPAEVVVPLLKRLVSDKEFIVRTFAVMGLGRKQSKEGFELLLEIVNFELDTNVRAEAADSLARYGEAALPHLLDLFARDSNWLVRHSIIAAIDAQKFPEVLYKLCQIGINDSDREVKLAAIGALGQLHQSNQQEVALDLLTTQATSEDPLIRAQVARVLPCFENKQLAQDTLLELRQDKDHRVVGASLEGLL